MMSMFRKRDLSHRLLERAVRENGNISMLKIAHHCDLTDYPLEFIGERLRDVYRDVMCEQVPPRFTHLLSQLEARAM